MENTNSESQVQMPKLPWYGWLGLLIGIIWVCFWVEIAVDAWKGGLQRPLYTSAAVIGITFIVIALTVIFRSRKKRRTSDNAQES